MTNNIIRVVLTGPESSGKTWLASKLAEHYKTVYMPEFARNYVESLNRHYTYEDVEIIAKKQIGELTEFLSKSNGILFIDTWLVITKVWFNEVYGRCPDWLSSYLENIPIDIYLLCTPDIEWKYDPVRENPNTRQYLFDIYKSEIENLNKSYGIIKGKYSDRLDNAIKVLTEFIDNK